jgi:hypothetical protein
MGMRLSHLITLLTAGAPPVGESIWPDGSTPGGVVEWLMALVLKTSEVKASVGSNPTPSAFQPSQPAG